MSRNIAAHSAATLPDEGLVSASAAGRALFASDRASSTTGGASAITGGFTEAAFSATGAGFVAPCACWRFFLAILQMSHFAALTDPSMSYFMLCSMRVRPQDMHAGHASCIRDSGEPPLCTLVSLHHVTPVAASPGTIFDETWCGAYCGMHARS